MIAASLLLADAGISFRLGNDIWSFNFGWGFVVYLIVAAVVGLIAEAILGWRAPLGIIGAIIAALVGIWLMTQVLVISGIGDLYIPTTPPVPLVRALIGAIIFVAIWHLLTGPYYRRRRRYYA